MCSCTRTKLYQSAMFLRRFIDKICHLLSQGSNSCVACHNAKDGPYCVAKCPTSKYPDTNGICQLCYSDCVDGCTGPGSHLGLGGCNSCNLVEVLEKMGATTKCLPLSSDECPAERFYSFTGKLKVETANGTQQIKVVSDTIRQVNKLIRNYSFIMITT